MRGVRAREWRRDEEREVLEGVERRDGGLREVAMPRPEREGLRGRDEDEVGKGRSRWAGEGGCIVRRISAKSRMRERKSSSGSGWFEKRARS